MSADPVTPPEDGGQVLHQHSAPDHEKIAGILAQTRVDLGGESVERYAEVLDQRFLDAGLDVSDDDRRAHAERAAGAI